MIELFLAGNHEQALEIHMSLDPLFKALPPRGGVNPIPALKAAIEMTGIPVGPPRLPMLESSMEHKKTLRKHLRRLGVLS
jgi:4-hydroxy-tetrahydrodipicolinate synthase